MDYRLEVVRIPVADMDRAKRFYQGLGWRMDFDSRHDDGTRKVQATPPGSACSAFFSTGIAPGQDLVVDDIDAARAELSGRGAEVSGVFHLDGARRIPGPAPNRESLGSFVSFNDWEGNNWLVQEVTTRLPGRTTSVLAAYGSVGTLWLTRCAVPPQRTTGTRRTSAMMTRTGPSGTRTTSLMTPPGRT